MTIIKTISNVDSIVVKLTFRDRFGSICNIYKLVSSEDFEKGFNGSLATYNLWRKTANHLAEMRAKKEWSSHFWNKESTLLSAKVVKR